MTTPIREMEAAHADVQAQFNALGTQYNALADEHRRLSATLAKDTSGAGRTATRDRLEWLAQEGDRIQRERQSLSDQMGRIMAELAPARTTLREARRALDYLKGAGPNDPTVVRLGVRQVGQEQHRLQKLISQLEA